MITKPEPVVFLSELLRELNRRRLAVIEQQNRVDTFVLEILSEANFTSDRPGAPVKLTRAPLI